MKWVVDMTDSAELELRKLLKAKVVTNFDVKVLLRWVDEMEEFGPKYIANSPEWHDHSLDRDWAGYRSSAFSQSGRVIYKIVDHKVVVEVHRVTTDHNYKK